MLTATYTLVALSVEHTNVRVGLQSLRQTVHANFLHRGALTAVQVQYANAGMQRLYEACHWRKLDKFLLPALRRATRLADSLLDSLDELSRQAGDALAVASAFAGDIEGSEQVDAFCKVVDQVCSALLARIEREEKELFPLARAAISGEAWFAIANNMLAHDAYRKEQRADAAPVRMARQAYRGRHERGHRAGMPLSTLH